MFCRFEKWVKIYPSKKDYYEFEYDIIKEKYKRQTLRLNILLGNTEPCKCKECNPNTSN